LIQVEEEFAANSENSTQNSQALPLITDLEKPNEVILVFILER